MAEDFINSIQTTDGEHFVLMWIPLCKGGNSQKKKEIKNESPSSGSNNETTELKGKSYSKRCWNLGECM